MAEEGNSCKLHGHLTVPGDLSGWSGRHMEHFKAACVREQGEGGCSGAEAEWGTQHTVPLPAGHSPPAPGRTVAGTATAAAPGMVGKPGKRALSALTGCCHVCSPVLPIFVLNEYENALHVLFFLNGITCPDLKICNPASRSS